MNSMATKLTSVLGAALAVVLLTHEPAEARRGGSFGSRGMRTYQAPRTTQTAPQQTAPVQRSMTPESRQPATAAAPNAAANAGAQQPRRGLGGMMGGILGGLAVGGLLGMLMGNGFGGMAGLMTALLQVALIGGAVLLVMALLRRRKQEPAAVIGGRSDYIPMGPGHGFEAPRHGGGGGAGAAAPETQSIEIGVGQADKEAFERLLHEVQGAFGREDYGALRERTTPEIMSYLSEELSQNAVRGHRNEVSGLKLLMADVAEAWREGETEYVTAAMRYESIDVVRDRDTGAVVSGDPDKSSETIELWTFVRRMGEPWKLSAIQEA